MYAVIFKAEIKNLGPEYSEMAAKLRDLAISRYGCKEFVACTEGDFEIAISYWEREADIVAWKQDVEHLEAQAKGRNEWYASYTVQVVEVIREYSN